MPVINIDTAVIVSICTFIAAIGGAFVWIRKAMDPVLRPMREMQAELDEIRRRTVRDYERLNEHDLLLKEQKEDSRAVLKAVLLVLNHIETGNNTGEIAAGRKELEHYILNR